MKLDDVKTGSLGSMQVFSWTLSWSSRVGPLFFMASFHKKDLDKSLLIVLPDSLNQMVYQSATPD